MHFKKEQQTYKPGSVSFHLRFGMSVIYLDLPSLANSVRSTPRHRTSSPTYVGIHDLATHQTYGLLHYDRSGKLLPHLFTLTPPKQGGSFLLYYSTLADSFPLGRMALFAARTFLSFTNERQTGLLHVTKVVKAGK